MHFCNVFWFSNGNVCQQDCNLFQCCIYNSTMVCEACNQFFVVVSLRQCRISVYLFRIPLFFLPYNVTICIFLNIVRLNRFLGRYLGMFFRFFRFFSFIQRIFFRFFRFRLRLRLNFFRKLVHIIYIYIFFKWFLICV